MRICVFGAASDSIDHIYLQAVEEFVFRLGQEGYGLVFGGGATGLMGAAARGMRDAGGEIIGVTPTFFKDRDVELLYKGCSAMIWTETMRDRKAIMEEKSDAFVVVPGGIGTFEELFEILTLKQLGQHEKPIIFYNVADYFKAYDMLMENGINQGFISPDCRDLYFISDSTEEILDYLKNYPNSEHRAEALEKIDSIDWAQASSLNTAEAYNEYITEHPDGNYRDEADELLRKIQQQTVTPEEKSIISNVFHQFFVSINSRNADNLTATIADNLTLLNKENATKDDVVEMMNKMYKADMTEMTWKLPGNYDIKKRDVEGTRFDYIVSFLANQDVVYSDASQNTTNKYRINAEVNSDGKIKLFKMTKIVE